MVESKKRNVSVDSRHKDSSGLYSVLFSLCLPDQSSPQECADVYRLYLSDIALTLLLDWWDCHTAGSQFSNNQGILIKQRSSSQEGSGWFLNEKMTFLSSDSQFLGFSCNFVSSFWISKSEYQRSTVNYGLYSSSESILIHFTFYTTFQVHTAEEFQNINRLISWKPLYLAI